MGGAADDVYAADAMPERRSELVYRCLVDPHLVFLVPSIHNIIICIISGGYKKVSKIYLETC